MALPALLSPNLFILAATLAALIVVAPWIGRLLERGVIVLLLLAIMLLAFSEPPLTKDHFRGLRSIPGWVHG